MKLGCLFILSLFLVLPLAPLCAAEVNEGDTDTSINATGLPLPRFASLRTDEVNMRTGPGTRYPIEWVLKRKGLPVEIIAEYEIWRRIREPDGAEGWVHKTALTGKRMAIVTGKGRDLRMDADGKAAPAAHLEDGAMGRLLSCNLDWCRLEFGDVKGWLPKNDFWGAYPKEVIK